MESKAYYGAHFRAFLIVLLFAHGLLLLGCATNPATGKRQIMLMSEGQEVDLGKKTDPQVIAEYGLYEDPELSRYINTIGQKLASVSHRPHLVWHFKIVDSPVVNAFALPGGYIYVTRGILAHFNSEAELAAVLGHEIGHVTARHTAARFSKAQLMGITLGLGGIFVPQFNQFSRLADTGLGILFLKFSRNDEKQADDLGVVYGSKAGYDPEAAVEVFSMLEQVSAQSGRSPLPSWLSTHPSPGNREARIREATAGRQGEKGIVNRSQYLERLDGILFGDDPKEGYLSGRTFVHPHLEFTLDFPQDWKVQNTKQYVLAVEPSEAAALKLTLTGSKEDPEQRAKRLAQKEGLRMVEGERERIGGNQAFLAVFEMDDPQAGVVRRSLDAFILFRGSVYRIQGLTKDGDINPFRRAFLSSMRSFSRLRSAEGLDTVPDRVRIHRVTSRGTLREIIRKHSTGTAPPQDVAVLNHLGIDAVLEPGSLVKVVVRGN